MQKPTRQICRSWGIRPWEPHMSLVLDEANGDFWFGVWENMGQLGKSTRNPLVLIVDHFFKCIFSAFAAFGWEKSPQNPVLPSEASQHHPKNRGFRRTADPYLRITHFGWCLGFQCCPKKDHMYTVCIYIYRLYQCILYRHLDSTCCFVFFDNQKKTQSSGCCRSARDSPTS